ncbi:MAG: hypothetical protein IJE04_00585 [Bacilli bacterium]|nr:hypothetical protein [Bacilli bacterium]
MDQNNNFNTQGYNTFTNNQSNTNMNNNFYQPPVNNQAPKKKPNIGLIAGIVGAVAVIATIGITFALKGNSGSLFGNKGTVKLYSDSLTLADGDTHKYNLYKENGNEVNMKIYKMTDYLVAYQNVDKDYNYFGFAFYNLDNEKNYVLETTNLGHNVENSGYINTDIEKKGTDFTNIHDIATKFGNSNGANEYSKENAKVEKISNTISKVTSVKTWGEEKYTYFIDIDDSHYFEIQVTCNPGTGCDLESETTKGTLKIFENLKIELVDDNDKENVGQTNNKNSIDERFEYYFAFKDIDLKKFDKSKALKSINDFNGNEITTYPITYEKLSSKLKPYYEKKGKYFDEWLETSVVSSSEIRWCTNSSDCYLTTNFYDSNNSSISEAMKSHKFYIEISGYGYNTILGISEDDTKDDIDLILETIGNPNEIYIHSEVYTKQENADYYLVYNYNDYMLAFNFTESSSADRSKDSALYIAPHLENIYYIDGNSFKDAINAIKSGTYTDYYDKNIDIVLK